MLSQIQEAEDDKDVDEEDAAPHNVHKQETDDVSQFQVPSTLVQHYVIVPARLRLLVLLGFLRAQGAKAQVTSHSSSHRSVAQCFSHGLESSRRRFSCCRVISLLWFSWASSSTPICTLSFVL